MNKKDPVRNYIRSRDKQVVENMQDDILRDATYKFTDQLIKTNYTKNFTWMGVPIIQYPTDLIVLQELIFDIKPDVIIETGTAFGGSALFYASVLSLIDDSSRVITIDIEHRPHASRLLADNPLNYMILPKQMDSISMKAEKSVILSIDIMHGELEREPRVMVCLDSDHSHDHVLAEMELYSQFVTIGSYMIVFDTAIEQFMTVKPINRPWGPGNNPATAVQEFRCKHPNKFVIDANLEQRALITAAPGGWLRRIA